ncbi:MAG: hypothetical protein Kow0090_15380 [Myxococcota bacterium]
MSAESGDTPNQEKGTRGEVFIFRIGRKRWALSTELIEQIFKVGDYTPVPFTPHDVLGVVYMSGKVVPLIVPHEIVGEKSDVTSWKGRDGLLFSHNENYIAIVVDGIEDIFHLPGDVEEGDRMFSSGLVRIANKKVFLLDLSSFIAEAKGRIKLLER